MIIVLAVAAFVFFWQKPWLDSAMHVSVTIMADGEPSKVVLRKARFFTEGRKAPVVEAEIDLAPWAGKLIKFEVEGSVSRRGLGSNSTGYVACEAEMATSEGSSPIEFYSWQYGGEARLHMRPVGPLVYKLNNDKDDRLVFTTKDSLWHCLWTPKSARLHLRLKAAPAAELVGALKPYAARVDSGSSSARLPARKPERRPDIFIYSVDALRPDHLGCYGYDRPTSPSIDAFAKEATLFKHAYTPTPWTRPSVATMMTGLYAGVHGAMHWSDGLAEWPVLIPEALQEGGYYTAGYVGSPCQAVPFGLDQGYNRYIYLLAPARWANEMVRKTLAEQPNKPVFIFTHTLEPHDPYSPKPENLKRFDRGFKGRYDGTSKSLEKLRVPYPDMTRDDIEHIIDRYDAEVWECDQGFANFIAELKRAGRYDNALIILTSDHGESFMEHKTFSHAFDLNYEDTQVVMIVKFPNGRFQGERVKERASSIDLMPTILAQTGARPKLPYRLPGEDLAQLALQPEAEPKRRIYEEISRWDGNEIDLLSVIDEDGYKRVLDVSVPPGGTATKESLGLWDLNSDPKEQHDLSEKLPVRAAYDEQLIAQWLLEQRQWRKQLGGKPPQVNFEESLRKELQSLGYVGGGVGAIAK